MGVLLPGYPARGPESEIRVTLVYNLATKRSIKIIYSVCGFAPPERQIVVLKTLKKLFNFWGAAPRPWVRYRNLNLLIDRRLHTSK